MPEAEAGSRPRLARASELLSPQPLRRELPDLPAAPIRRPPRGAPPARRRPRAARSSAPATSRGSRSAVRVRKLTQAADDGYRNELVPGVKASADAERLAAELAFATARLAELAADPPGAVRADRRGARSRGGAVARVPHRVPRRRPRATTRSPRSARRTCRGRRASCPTSTSRSGCARRTSRRRARARCSPTAPGRTRAGSQPAAFAGEASWTPERRFDRLFERLALPGFGRPGRYELLVSLGRLGVVDVARVDPAAHRRRDDRRRQARLRDRRQDAARAPRARARRRGRAADRGARPRAVQLGGAAARPRDDGLDGRAVRRTTSPRSPPCSASEHIRTGVRARGAARSSCAAARPINAPR